MTVTFTIKGDRQGGPPSGVAERLAYLVAYFQQTLVDRGSPPQSANQFPEFMLSEFRTTLYANSYNVTSLEIKTTA